MKYVNKLSLSSNSNLILKILLLGIILTSLITFTSCDFSKPVDVSANNPENIVPSFSTDKVDDLTVISVTDSSVELSWVQVNDGSGRPSNYRLKYSTPPINWRTATVGCNVNGTRIGDKTSCVVQGLTSNTSYDFQLMSYKLVNNQWSGATYSNIAKGTTSKKQVYVWVSQTDILTRPISGPEWDVLFRDASINPGVANVGEQDSNHDVYTLAAALVCVRTNQYCVKARQGVLDAMYTEEDPSDADGDAIPMSRWLAVGRNLGSYVIAADLLDLRRGGSTGSDGERVQVWLESFMTKQLMDNNSRINKRGISPFHSAANGAAQEGFVFVALASYLRDKTALDRGWDAFRTYACDPTAPDNEHIDLRQPLRNNWTDTLKPCAVNPMGSTKIVPSGLPGAGSVRRLDGSLSGDMWRGGVYQWKPIYTQYPWVGLEGFVPAAIVLANAGYPAFDVADHAVLRTHDYLWYLRSNTGEVRWFDGIRAREIVHLVNVVYKKSFPVNRVVGRGRTVGYTTWTHY